jgi:hypothetical protein
MSEVPEVQVLAMDTSTVVLVYHSCCSPSALAHACNCLPQLCMFGKLGHPAPCWAGSMIEQPC